MHTDAPLQKTSRECVWLLAQTSSKQREAEFGLHFTLLHGTSSTNVPQTQFFLLRMHFLVTPLAPSGKTMSTQKSGSRLLQRAAMVCHFFLFSQVRCSSFRVCQLLPSAFALFGAHGSACTKMPCPEFLQSSAFA